MRSRLISVLQQSVQRSQKFADYNFRNYFVAKYATKLEQVETDTFGPITEEILNKAEADLEMLIRQTTIQEIDHSILDSTVEFRSKPTARDILVSVVNDLVKSNCFKSNQLWWSTKHKINEFSHNYFLIMILIIMFS